MYGTREQENLIPLTSDEPPTIAAEGSGTYTKVSGVEYVSESEPEPEPVISEAPVETSKTLRIFKVKSPVNLRVTPVIENHNILGPLKKGVIVKEREILASTEGWIPVTFEKYNGWVKSEYLEEV